MTQNTAEIQLSEAESDYYDTIDALIDEEIETDVNRQRAALQAAKERYERLDGLEIQCAVCHWRRADAVTRICEHCQDLALEQLAS